MASFGVSSISHVPKKENVKLFEFVTFKLAK